MNKDEQDKLNKELIEVSQRGDFEQVQILIAKGADVNYDDNMALVRASFHGQLDIVKYLVKKGAVINARSDLSLIYASSKGNVEIVKYLVENGANINAKQNMAVSVATTTGHLELIKYFIIEKDFAPEIVLTKAIKNNKHEIIKWCKKYISIKELNDKLELDLNTNNIKHNKVKI